jgi:two-component system OmpR family sensor kinase
MNTPSSIRSRLSAALIGISLAWGAAVSALVWVAVQYEVDELLDSTLHESAEILGGLLAFGGDRLTQGAGISLPVSAHDEALVWQVVSARHEVLLRSYQAPEQPLAARLTEGLSGSASRWRVYAMPLSGNDQVLLVAQRATDRQEARFEAAALSAGAALLVGLISAAWLRRRVRGELEPISTLSMAVQDFDPLQPGAGLAAATRAELVPMHKAIVSLGARVRKQFATERAFSAQAAHALRTPLAGMVVQLAAAQRLAPPDVQIHLSRSREAAERLRRVVSALLTLFRTNQDLRRQDVDLANTVRHLAIDGLTIETAGAACVAADPDLLAAAVMNLFENSLRFGATRVNIEAQCSGDITRIVVSDNGDGIDEATRERLQGALDTQASEGQQGLGLLLVDLVARAHGGRLRLLPSHEGFSVELTLASGGSGDGE